MTLLILAAGMGSRYGSLKQIDTVGPNNETIIDYSVYDAIRAGFKKVVFVIRHSFAEEFSRIFNADRFKGQIAVDTVYQELDSLPKGYSVPQGREKPWGTNHAVIMAAENISGPFAVINADDFYGREAFQTMSAYLNESNGQNGRYAMVAYKLKNTLSENGTVSRGVCSKDREDNLVSVVERTSIERVAGNKVINRDADNEIEIDGDSPVSMNFFGFTPDYFHHSIDGFRDFLDAETTKSNLKAEYFMPVMVNKLISEDKARVKMLSCDAKWFGVTYKEDKPMVARNIAALIEQGAYPESLWS